jgi:hypothetical protein
MKSPRSLQVGDRRCLLSSQAGFRVGGPQLGSRKPVEELARGGCGIVTGVLYPGLSFPSSQLWAVPTTEHILRQQGL